MTLANFIDHLSPWIPKLKLLASVHNKAVSSCSERKNVYRVWYLLGALHESIMQHYSMGDNTKEVVSTYILYSDEYDILTR